MIAANQIGEYAPGRRSGGRSMIVDPWGVVLAQAADADGVIVAELDLAALARIRALAAVAREPARRRLPLAAVNGAGRRCRARRRSD